MSDRNEGGNDGSDPTAEAAPAISHVTGTGIPIRGNDIDTDQIIPARFLKVVTFDGLGEVAFFDQRFTEWDEPKNHPFNEQRYQGASILVVNANFGCGSSREHAPQALKRWGIDAIVGESFAEIFAGNCLALGIPTVTAPPSDIASIQEWVEDHPDGLIEVDIVQGTVTYGGTSIHGAIDDAQQTALVEGVWDTTALLRANADLVAETAVELPYTN